MSASLKVSVIFLHGYGASGDDLITLSEQWEDVLPSTLFISPHAPSPCDINPSGYQWFSLPDFSPFTINMGLNHVQPTLTKYIKDLLAEYSLSPADLAVVGFSQGTIVALNLLFSIPNIGCVLGYAGAFFPPPSVKDSLLISSKVMLIHGTSDTVVPYAALHHAQSSLKNFGIDAETYTCIGLGHSIDYQGITRGGKFLAQNLYPSSQTILL